MIEFVYYQYKAVARKIKGNLVGLRVTIGYHLKDTWAR